MPDNHERTRQEPGQGEGQPLVISYSLAASFHTREEGQEPHNQVKQILKQDDDLDLSSFLFERKPRDPQQPRLERPWYLVVIGDTPPEPVQQQFQAIFRAGELTPLSLETIVTLAQRRAQEGKPGMYRDEQHEP